MNVSFNPRIYTDILGKRKWIVIIAVLFVILGILYSHFTLPELYESKSIINIGHVYDPVDKDNKRVIDWLTTREIITSDTFLIETVKTLGWNIDPLSLKDKVSVENQENNILTTINVKLTSPGDAQELCNALAEQFVQKYNGVYQAQIGILEKDVQRIEDIIEDQTKLIKKTEQKITNINESGFLEQEDQELKISLLYDAVSALYSSRKDLLVKVAGLKDTTVRSTGFEVLYPATLPENPVSKKLPVVLVIGIVVSFVLGSGVAFLVDYWSSLPSPGGKKGK